MLMHVALFPFFSPSGFTSVLVAWPQVKTSTLLTMLMPVMAPSAAFAAYHMAVQPLAEACADLKSSRNAVNVEVSESWFRYYQVLPMRTHPEMSMSGTGGYLLRGVRIENAGDEQQQAKRQRVES